MRRKDKPVDPRWVAWAEEQTVKQLEAQLEARRKAGDAEETGPAEETGDSLRIVHMINLDDLSEQPAGEVDLSNRQDAEPEIRVATRSDGLVIRIHRENV